jgi:FixJ family two-component response regulator
MKQTPVIHIVDDDESFQVAVSRLLKAAGYEVRAYPTAWEFLMTPCEEGPGCILLDVHLPGPSGLDLQHALGLKNGSLPVIFVTGYGDIPMSVRAMKAGASDFLTKPFQREVLLKAVEHALAADAANSVDRELLRKARACFTTLTAREREIFERVVAGRMNKEIAAELGMAERTVKAHRAQLMEKMQAGSIADLVRLGEALRNGPAAPANSVAADVRRL